MKPSTDVRGDYMKLLRSLAQRGVVLFNKVPANLILRNVAISAFVCAGGCGFSRIVATCVLLPKAAGGKAARSAARHLRRLFGKSILLMEPTSAVERVANGFSGHIVNLGRGS